jgi:hypothetical protein
MDTNIVLKSLSRGAPPFTLMHNGMMSMKMRFDHSELPNGAALGFVAPGAGTELTGYGTA